MKLNSLLMQGSAVSERTAMVIKAILAQEHSSLFVSWPSSPLNICMFSKHLWKAKISTLEDYFLWTRSVTSPVSLSCSTGENMSWWPHLFLQQHGITFCVWEAKEDTDGIMLAALTVSVTNSLVYHIRLFIKHQQRDSGVLARRN